MNTKTEQISIKYVLPIFLCFCSFAFGNNLFASQNQHKEKPNIIFIMADDVGYGDLGCYGQKLIKTPNIDRLASEGILATHVYAGSCVCTPSRSVLMTGLDVGHTPARDNIPYYHTYLEKDDYTIAKMLKQAGYLCGGVGKWSLGDPGTVGDATNQGFDMWFGYQNQDHAHDYFPEYLDDSYRKENNFRYNIPGNTKSHKFYSQDLIADRSLQFIKDSWKKPFFLYAAFTLPHYAGQIEDPDGYAVPSTDPYSNMNWDNKAKKYAAMIHILDRDVGRIMDLVDELGLKNNTLIIFTSDNGPSRRIAHEFNSNGPFRGFKRDLTEGGIRVPFIARWPDQVPVGKICDEVIAFQDMMPTFAELSGAEVSGNVDGFSVVEALKGGKLKKQHEYLYWDYGHCRDRYDQAVLLMGKWKGIRLGQHGEIQLYNLEKDTGEVNDVAGKYPEIVLKIEETMKKAVFPSPKYPVGIKYIGSPIWTKDWN